MDLPSSLCFLSVWVATKAPPWFKICVATKGPPWFKICVATKGPPWLNKYGICSRVDSSRLNSSFLPCLFYRGDLLPVSSIVVIFHVLNVVSFDWLLFNPQCSAFVALTPLFCS